jgi:hypothetical protein
MFGGPIDDSSNSRVHSQHDDLAHELESWFTNSAPEIDYFVTEHWYGYLSNPDDPLGARLILRVNEPNQVSPALADAKSLCDDHTITIWGDDRKRKSTVDSALREAGCTSVKATTHLALVGPVHAAKGPETLVIKDVSIDDLEEWSITKIRCFDDLETLPGPDRLATEMAVRTPEMALAKLQLATIDSVPVGVLGSYSGPDQLVFNLGTRIPFRQRGSAQALLAHWVEAGMASNCRSLIINADDPGRPLDLYRRTGFVDEIYWYQRYELSPAT